MKRISKKIQKLQIEGIGIHLITDVVINGVKLKLVIDTGASRTVLDYGKMQEFDIEIEKTEHLSSGIGTNTMESMLCTLEAFSIGNLKIKDFTVVLVDLQHVNESYALLKLPPVIGVLGGDILDKYNAKIDYAKSKLFFNFDETNEQQ